MTFLFNSQDVLVWKAHGNAVRTMSPLLHQLDVVASLGRNLKFNFDVGLGRTLYL